MVSTSFDKSSLFQTYNIVQNTMNIQVKDLILFSLRDMFSNSEFYSYKSDNYGFPQVVDHTNLPLDAGIYDNITTRLCIQEISPEEPDFFPAIMVRSGTFSSTPISFNRERGSVQYEDMIFEDGYGNIKAFKYPKFFIFAGAWEGTLNIDVHARDMRTTDELVGLIHIAFEDIYKDELIKEGLFVSQVSNAGISTEDDRNNKMFKDTVTLKIRTEWRRHIPVSNVIEVLNMAVDFGFSENEIGPNIALDTELTLIENLNNL